MADFDIKETEMLTRWYGNPDLVHNDAFWQDCLHSYEGKTVTLPYDDTPEQRREIAPLLSCSPAVCGPCRREKTIPITTEDYRRISGTVRKHIDWKINEYGGRYLDISGCCRFLDNGACTMHDRRPAFCRSYPMMEPRETISSDGTVFRQLQVKISCPHALGVIELLMKRACAGGKLMLLPDLSIIPTYENVEAMFAPEKQEAPNVL